MGAIPAGMNQQKIDLHDSISTRKEHSAVHTEYPFNLIYLSYLNPTKDYLVNTRYSISLHRRNL